MRHYALLVGATPNLSSRHRGICCTSNTSKSGSPYTVHVSKTDFHSAQGAEQHVPGQQNPSDANALQVPPTQGLDVPQGPFVSTGAVNGAAAPAQPPANAQAASASAAPTPMSTVANPAVPYLAVNAPAPADPNTHIAPPNYGQAPNGSRFIPYTPPGVPPLVAAGGSVSAPVAPRQAILAPPVKKPGGRRKSVKTSETVEEDSASPQEGQAEKESGAEGPKKGPLDSINAADFTKPHVRLQHPDRLPVVDIHTTGWRRSVRKLCHAQSQVFDLQGRATEALSSVPPAPNEVRLAHRKRFCSCYQWIDFSDCSSRARPCSCRHPRSRACAHRRSGCYRRRYIQLAPIEPLRSRGRGYSRAAGET